MTLATLKAQLLNSSTELTWQQRDTILRAILNSSAPICDKVIIIDNFERSLVTPLDTIRLLQIDLGVK